MTIPTERRADRFGVVALAASGTLAAHQLGYLSDTETAAMHSYLAVVGPVVLLIAFVAGWVAAVRILRRDGGRAPTLGRLTAAQLGLYAAMEIVERLLGDGIGSLWSVPVVCGLIAQPLVAWAALRILRISAAVLEALTPRLQGAARILRRRPLATVFDILPPRRGGILLRGPPVG